MKLPERLDDLPIEREWRWQRFGWVVLGLIVVAELLGVFGGGWIASARAEREVEGDRYAVVFQEWNRYATVTELDVFVHAPGANGTQLNVTFDGEAISRWTIRSSQPGADSGELGPAGGTYGYKVDDWSEPLRVRFEYLPQRAGVWTSYVELQAGNEQPVRLDLPQRVFP